MKMILLIYNHNIIKITANYMTDRTSRQYSVSTTKKTLPKYSEKKLGGFRQNIKIPSGNDFICNNNKYLSVNNKSRVNRMQDTQPITHLQVPQTQQKWNNIMCDVQFLKKRIGEMFFENSNKQNQQIRINNHGGWKKKLSCNKKNKYSNNPKNGNSNKKNYETKLKTTISRNNEIDKSHNKRQKLFQSIPRSIQVFGKQYSIQSFQLLYTQILTLRHQNVMLREQMNFMKGQLEKQNYENQKLKRNMKIIINENEKLRNQFIGRDGMSRITTLTESLPQEDYLDDCNSNNLVKSLNNRRKQKKYVQINIKNQNKKQHLNTKQTQKFFISKYLPQSNINHKKQNPKLNYNIDIQNILTSEDTLNNKRLQQLEKQNIQLKNQYQYLAQKFKQWLTILTPKFSQKKLQQSNYQKKMQNTINQQNTYEKQDVDNVLNELNTKFQKLMIGSKMVKSKQDKSRIRQKLFHLSQDMRKLRNFKSCHIINQ